MVFLENSTVVSRTPNFQDITFLEISGHKIPLISWFSIINGLDTSFQGQNQRCGAGTFNVGSGILRFLAPGSCDSWLRDPTIPGSGILRFLAPGSFDSWHRDPTIPGVGNCSLLNSLNFQLRLRLWPKMYRQECLPAPLSPS